MFSSAPGPESAPAASPAPAANKSTAVPAAGAPAAGTLVVPVYWVSSTDDHALLAREYVQVPDTGNTAVSALRTVLEQRSPDPDYTSPWQPATTVSVTADAWSITVDLSVDAFSDTSVDPVTASAGIQQLLWTVTSAVQKDLPVTVLVDGNPGYRAWDVVDLTGPLHRSDEARVAVWIDSPHENATVTGAVHVTGQGRATGHRFSWKVTTDSVTVASGTSTGTPTSAGGWSQFTIDLTLPAGRYLLTVSAQTPDQTDTGPDRSWPDTKTLVVG
jgi:hypothetical protein